MNEGQKPRSALRVVHQISMATAVLGGLVFGFFSVKRGDYPVAAVTFAVSIGLIVYLGWFSLRGPGQQS